MALPLLRITPGVYDNRYRSLCLQNPISFNVQCTVPILFLFLV